MSEIDKIYVRYHDGRRELWADLRELPQYTDTPEGLVPADEDSEREVIHAEWSIFNALWEKIRPSNN